MMNRFGMGNAMPGGMFGGGQAPSPQNSLSSGFQQSRHTLPPQAQAMNHTMPTQAQGVPSFLRNWLSGQQPPAPAPQPAAMPQQQPPMTMLNFLKGIMPNYDGQGGLEKTLGKFGMANTPVDLTANNGFAGNLYNSYQKFMPQFQQQAQPSPFGGQARNIFGG